MKLRPEPILVGLLCLGPFVLALVLYFGLVDGGALPVVENPERELVAGARALPAVTLRSAQGEAAEEPWASYRWSLIYVGELPCDEDCRGALRRLAEVHGALGHEAARLRRVFLYSGEGPPSVADPALLVGRLDPGRNALWDELFGRNGGAERVFVADPLGNLVVTYPAGADRRAMLEDLERLLDVSRIG